MSTDGVFGSDERSVEDDVTYPVVMVRLPLDVYSWIEHKGVWLVMFCPSYFKHYTSIT